MSQNNVWSLSRSELQRDLQEVRFNSQFLVFHFLNFCKIFIIFQTFPLFRDTNHVLIKYVFKSLFFIYLSVHNTFSYIVSFHNALLV